MGRVCNRGNDKPNVFTSFTQGHNSVLAASPGGTEVSAASTPAPAPAPAASAGDAPASAAAGDAGASDPAAAACSGAGEGADAGAGGSGILSSGSGHSTGHVVQAVKKNEGREERMGWERKNEEKD